MNGREALRALMNGSMLVNLASGVIARCSVEGGLEIAHRHGGPWNTPGSAFLDNMYVVGGWEIFQEPLTDEQLIAEWETNAKAIHVPNYRTPEDVRMDGYREALQRCALQLRERKL